MTHCTLFGNYLFILMGCRSKSIFFGLSIIWMSGLCAAQTSDSIKQMCFEKVDLQAQKYGVGLLQKLPQHGNQTVGSYPSCSDVLNTYQTEQTVAARSKLKYCVEPSARTQILQDYQLTSKSDTIQLRKPIEYIGKQNEAVKKYVVDQMKITLGVFKSYNDRSMGIYEYDPIDFTGSMASMAEETNQSYYTLSSLVSVLATIPTPYQHPCWSKVYTVPSTHLPTTEMVVGVAYGPGYNGDPVVIATQYQEFYGQDRNPLHGTTNNWLQAWYLDPHRTSLIGGDISSMIGISSVTKKVLMDPHVRGYTMNTDTGAFYVGFRDNRILVRGL